MSKQRDLTGAQFERLTVIELAGRDKARHSLWRCRCACGAEITVSQDKLVSGNTKSCGCLRIDVSRETGKRTVKSAQAAKITHGRSKTRLERIYMRMRQRCLNPKNPDFRHYGGRGIAVCAEWLEDIFMFFAWADTSGYAPDLTIERKDVNGNYEPGNCCWVPGTEQPKNTRRSRKIAWSGETRSVVDWERHFGTKKDEIGKRVRAGEAPEAVLADIAGWGRA